MKYSYYNKSYPNRLLCISTMYEYLMDLVGHEKMYIGINELSACLNDVLDKA